MLKTKDIIDEFDKRIRLVSKDVTFPLDNKTKKTIEDSIEMLRLSQIDEYSKKLMIDVNRKYTKSTLFRMRQFYTIFSDEKVATLSQLLTWSHYVELLSCNDVKKSNIILK